MSWKVKKLIIFHLLTLCLFRLCWSNWPGKYPAGQSKRLYTYRQGIDRINAIRSAYGWTGVRLWLEEDCNQSIIEIKE